MKIPDNLKKSSFVNGALFVTICIIITKILGVLYVIPFHAMIGESGGALYGYAYTIYVFFLSISSAGIPLAISKIISESIQMLHIRIMTQIKLCQSAVTDHKMLQFRILAEVDTSDRTGINLNI